MTIWIKKGGDLAFFGALVLHLLALDLLAFVAVVGGIGLAVGILDIMKDGSGKGCASIVLVCADCKRQVWKLIGQIVVGIDS